ncbi:MAG: hypothetical protein RSA27_06750, partial [Oscillospiraceae bacterium]
KSLGFSKQIAKSFSLELQRVESSIQNFVNKEMKNENNFTTYKTIFNQKLNEIKGSSNNIVGAFVLRKGEVLYTTDSYYKDIATENLMTEIKDEPLWQVAGLSNENYVSHKKNIFVYCIPIKFENAEIDTMLCVDVACVSLFSSFDTDNLFLKYASIVLSTNDNNIYLKGNQSLKSLEAGSHVFDSDGNLYYKNQIENENYCMGFRLPFYSVNKNLTYIKVVFGVLWVIIMTLCFLTISKFYKTLSGMLVELDEKIEDYIETKK